MRGFIETEEVLRELEAQYGALKTVGVNISHIDGHNHVHLLPGICEAFEEIIPQNIWVRLPYESGADAVNPSGKIAVDIYNNAENLGIRITTIP